MRVTTRMAVGTLVTNLNRSYERIVDFQNGLSSGTRINNLSDDPAGVERALALRSELRNIEQFQKNIGDGTGWLELTEVTLNEMETIFVEARGLAVQGSTSTYNASQRNSIADQIDQFLEHTISLSESRYRGRYIFSGTQVSHAPYVPQRDENGNILAVGPRDDTSGSIEREVTDGIAMKVNISGQDLFEDPKVVRIPLGDLLEDLNDDDAARASELFGTDKQLTLSELEETLNDPNLDPPLSAELRTVLEERREDFSERMANPFDILIELRNSLRDNDIERVRGTLSGLTAVRENISSMRGLVGSRVNRMEITRNMLDRVSTEMSTILSEDEDIDLTSTIVNLRQEQDVFQAALASGSTVIPQSLMDFI